MIFLTCQSAPYFQSTAHFVIINYMKLYAISDLHLGQKTNLYALTQLPHYPEDWLIVAGDVGESEDHFHVAFTLLTERFAKVLWTPGNHDLWTLPSEANSKNGTAARGDAKYRRLVEICRNYNVLTPEDPYVLWPASVQPLRLTPIFLLYDYSFRPDHVAEDEVLDWAAEENTICADEALLHPDPYPTRQAWSAERYRYTEQRLMQLSRAESLVLINHYPLRSDPLSRLKRIPRFTPWCGTKLTHNWHVRFNTEVVVYGHLHIRATDTIDNVRFEEVSLGYANQWNHDVGMASYLRQILPAPTRPNH